MHYVWKEWKESIRGKGLWLSFAIIILVSLSLMFRTSSVSIDQGFYVLLINLFDAFIYIIPILALFLGAFSIYQEKIQKTLIMLLTRKDTFFSFLLKKSIAVQLVILLPVLIWFFAYLAGLKLFFVIDWKSYFTFLLAIVCMMFIFAQIGILIGSICQSKMQIIGFSIVVWFYFFFLHDFILLFFLPDVTYENVKLFSSFYFFNPLQTARMFLESSLGLYNIGHMSKLMETFLWMKPGVFMAVNFAIFVLLSFFGAALFHRKEGSE